MPIEPEIVAIPSGSVLLGAPEFPADSKLPHRWRAVTVDVPAFGVGRFAVTVAELRCFAEETGYAVSTNLLNDPRFRRDDAPAAYVSWIDAVRYVQWLARVSGQPYRLLRDAEYERAARGGVDGRRFPWGDDPPNGRADWNNPKGCPKPVGSFAPNGYELHDMVGSIWSWCEECYDQVVSSDSACMCYDDTAIRDVRLNPICRGGSYKSADPTVLWCAYRHEDPTDGRFDCIGFRLALSLTGTAA